MKRFPEIGWIFLLTAVGLAGTATAQSPRADIAWFSGGHLSPMSSATYSPDGTQVASSGYFGDSLKLWRASDGTMIRTLRNTNGPQFIFAPMQPIIFLPDGKTIIALGEGSAIGVWNVASGKLLRIMNVPGSDIALSPDGTLIAVAANTLIKLVRFSDGTVVRSINWPSDQVQRVTFSIDGSIVAGGDRVGILRTFRVSDGAPGWSISAHTGSIGALRYSPDGTRIATGGTDHMVRLWNSENGDPAGTLVGHTGNVTSIAFSVTGLILASGSLDDTARIWTSSTGNLVATLPQPSDVNAVSFNSITSRLAVACDNDLREWDVPSQTLARSLTRASKQISGTAFTPDSTKMVSSSYDGRVSIHDAVTGVLLRQMIPGGNAFAVAASADTVAVGINVPNAVNLYRLSDGALLRTLNPQGDLAYTYAAAFSPDGATLATGHFNNTVQLWDVSDGTFSQLLTGQSGAVNGVAYSSDGAILVAASGGGYVYVWDAAGNPIRTLGPVGQALSSVAISPDNQFVLAGGQSGLLQLWRLDNGALVYAFSDGATVSQVRFAPSGFAFYAGRTTASLNTTGSIRIYRTADHAVLETYTLETSGFGNNPAGPLSFALSPNGQHFAYGRDDGTIVVAYNTLIAAPSFATLFMGQLISGSFPDLVMADGATLAAQPAFNGNRQSAPLQIDLGAHLPLSNPLRLSLQVVASANAEGIQQEIWMLNVQNGTFELVDARPAATSDQPLRVVLGPNIARYIDALGNISARLKWRPSSQTGSRSWSISLDQAVWAAGL